MGSPVDLGWSLGLMTMGVGAYLRRFLPSSVAGNASAEYVEDSNQGLSFGPTPAFAISSVTYPICYVGLQCALL